MAMWRPSTPLEVRKEPLCIRDSSLAGPSYLLCCGLFIHIVLPQRGAKWTVRPNKAKRLTVNFQVDGLAVLANGVGGAAQVLARVSELDVLQREGGKPGVAEHHNVPVQTLEVAHEKEQEKMSRRLIVSIYFF